MPNVLITGAGQGIGRATALLLAERGWKVGAYDLQDFPHPDLHTGIMDVTKPTAWETALADFRTNVGEIDVLVNNAGILYGGSFMEAGSFEKDSALVDVNIKGVLYGCRAARPHAQLRHPHPVRTTATARMCGTASAVQSAHMTPDTALDSTAMAMAWAAKEILGNSAPHSAFDFPLPPAHELSVQGFSYARGNESSGIPH